jgi:hypothetical protein
MPSSGAMATKIRKRSALASKKMGIGIKNGSECATSYLQLQTGAIFDTFRFRRTRFFQLFEPAGK